MRLLNNLPEVLHNKVRVRACGILIIDNKILLAAHKFSNRELFWSPPGGGVEFGESLKKCIKREFKEETLLDINVGNYLGTSEYIAPPLHAIEIFFSVTAEDCKFYLGTDPEFEKNDQILIDLKLFSIEELKALPFEQFHKCLHKINDFIEIFDRSLI